MVIDRDETRNQSQKNISALRNALSKVTSSKTELNQAMAELGPNPTERDVNDLIEWINDLLD